MKLPKPEPLKLPDYEDSPGPCDGNNCPWKQILDEIEEWIDNDKFVTEDNLGSEIIMIHFWNSILKRVQNKIADLKQIHLKGGKG